ncbi:DNA/RNA non-specific endonuclease [Adlercreutzia sp. R25]|uniref:DNA/RNA non-specific endonuclease n=1 Tax=Adlercreutzia shanghongiae TaxID=3111773 RepID=A0ABU6IY65_9ACTN|nr:MULTISPECIES: DNA/RNA non-specific endonuclease [unclassified Adlercreutzia]MEC4272484.1 DNA/RNA non-specific endonuclease [Adlercreutzia sp. R25]MEC4294616.1 DNA/RNA non-specific endonuclease [Adlercreutzia sp. R22]
MNFPFSIGRRASALAAIAALACVLAGCSPAAGETTTALPDTGAFEQQISAEEAVASEASETTAGEEPSEAVAEAPAVSPADIPAYDGSPYVYVNGGEPSFGDEERAAAPGTESYGELDALGRCTTAFAVVGTETMPDEERGSIGEVKPTGWQMAKYEFVDGKYLYNRCHLLGFQLTGENANERNLITGTRYLNVEGMLPFENAVADYVRSTGNHVLMAATPLFEGDELVARGVAMMAESVEDGGDGVSFNVFCYNVQPGVAIDYATGDNRLDGTIEGTPLPDVSGPKDDTASGTSGAAPSAEAASDSGKSTEEPDESAAKGVAEYVLNTNSKKFHMPSCSSVDQMSAKNRQDVQDTRESIVEQGYDPCKRCNP